MFSTRYFFLISKILYDVGFGLPLQRYGHNMVRKSSTKHQNMKTIVVENLSIGYKDKVVNRSLNAEVEGGRLTCLIGTNGVGKSTLLRTMASLQPAMEGRVLMRLADGTMKPVSAIDRTAMARLVSVVFTEQPDVKLMTVADVVGMGRMPYTGFFGTLNQEDRSIVERALADTGMHDFAERRFEALSDGERQKVMIAKALAQQTPIILLDEPTAFLDYPSKVEMMKMLHRLANEMGKTILLSTHDLELALQYADCLLHLGQTLRNMSRDELRQFINVLK